ncbi:MAG TPA: TIGR02453 family protein [Rhodanobacteraceae bacterium]
MPQTYFSPATFRFLRALARNNSRAWFKAHQANYETHVRGPFLQLIGDLQGPVERISRHYRADPRKVGGSMFRPQRDTRFSHDKQPYKTFAGGRAFHERRREIAAPSFYIEIAPGGCFVGAGLWRPENHTLQNIRNFIVDNPAAWKRATRTPAFRQHYAFWGESLQRPPHGFPPDHPLLEDLKRKSFAAGAEFDDALACSPKLFALVAAHWKRLAPLVDYLCAAQNLEF